MAQDHPSYIFFWEKNGAVAFINLQHHHALSMQIYGVLVNMQDLFAVQVETFGNIMKHLSIKEDVVHDHHQEEPGLLRSVTPIDMDRDRKG